MNAIPSIDAPDFPFRFQRDLTLGGVTFQVLCGDTPLLSPEGDVMATVYSMAYMRPGANRPILFIFNGGPGSPPTWLQYGFLGPRLAVPENGMPGSPDGALRENPDCLMDLCDLVFYHPPGAGYSRVFSERWNAQVFGDHADAQAAESFIRSFLDEHGTHRPFFLLGESFGSTRASLLSDRLSDLNLRGVVHVGPGYTGDVSIPRSVKDLIPLSATSWYYDERAGKPDLQTFLAPVRVFLYRDYLPALCQGTMLPPGERQRVAQQLEAFTGLPAAYYLAHDLHVSREDFRKERLKAKGLRIGSFDTRFTLPADETQDPTLARLDPWLDAAGRAHEQELGLQLRRSFRPNAFDESSAFLWPFDAEYDMEGLGGNWYPMGMTVSEAMHRAWEKKPSLRFFFATGLFDTVATVENTRFAVSHTRVPMENIELHEYESGHAVYADERSRHALARDLRAFLLSGLA